MLLALADYAHADGSKAFPSVETLMQDARLSERQVRNCLRSLERNGSIVQTGVSPRGTNVYRIAMEGGQILPPAKSDEKTSQIAPDPPVNHQPTTTDLGARDASQLDLAGGSTAIAPDEKIEPKEVAGVKVTTVERQFALAILAAFNAAFETKFRGVYYLRGIIGRIREHPELTLVEHVDIIGRSKANPWWKDDASPAVIYGNDGVFERAMNAKDKPAGPDLSVYDD